MDRLAPRVHGLSRRRLLQSSFALASIGLVAGCSRLVLPQEPPAKIHRVGFLADVPDTYFSYFLDGLGERGYVEGDSVVVERRYARGDYARFPALIAELEGLGAECIVCGGLPACIAAKGSTDLRVGG